MKEYGLMIYIKSGIVKEDLKIMKWIIKKRNEKGGFD